MPAAPSYTPPRRSRTAQILAVLAGGLIGLIAFGLLAGGGLALWGDAQKDEDGFVSSRSERFATKSSALATANLDVDVDGLGWLASDDTYGKVRLEVTPRAGKPVFVGIASTRDVSRYLRDAAHASVTDVEFSPFRATYAEQSGSRRPAPPARQRFWVASAGGRGKQAVTWDVQDGSWSVVVMNADGSPGVAAAVSAGAEVPFLPEVGWGLIGGGLVLLAAAGGLVYLAVRTPRSPAGGADPRDPAPAPTG